MPNSKGCRPTREVLCFKYINRRYPDVPLCGGSRRVIQQSESPGIRYTAQHAGCPDLARHDDVLRLALALPLSPACLIDFYRHRQRLHAAAVAGAAHWCGAEIVEADGDTGMRVRRADAVGRIEPDPAEIRDVRLCPGMAGLLVDHAVGAQEMSGDEARGHAAASRAGDED